MIVSMGWKETREMEDTWQKRVTNKGEMLLRFDLSIDLGWVIFLADIQCGVHWCYSAM